MTSRQTSIQPKTSRQMSILPLHDEDNSPLDLQSESFTQSFADATALQPRTKHRKLKSFRECMVQELELVMQVVMGERIGEW